MQAVFVKVYYKTTRGVEKQAGPSFGLVKSGYNNKTTAALKNDLFAQTIPVSFYVKKQDHYVI